MTLTEIRTHFQAGRITAQRAATMLGERGWSMTDALIWLAQ